ncbi:antibiotic biosynthesis monooxygenase [Anatilimnocola sp. NA78]|uniref:antibiotic biosynthesis monooxygenase family protein n=1 Tax=Anatilimnocola sp. NA78 TaxID=3415683 RepID=UPI003CE5B059
MNVFAATPQPPYYAVIFSSQLADDVAGYGELAERMLELAAQQPGYLGVEGSREASGLGITVSYWASREHIVAWKQNSEHALAQKLGRSTFYRDFRLRICIVESESSLLPRA